MKIYIIGSNHEESREAYRRTMQQLVASGVKKNQIINPGAINFADTTTDEEKRKLRLDLVASSNAVYVLRNWKQSIEARKELTYAQQLQITQYWEELEDIAELKLHVKTGAINDKRYRPAGSRLNMQKSKKLSK